MKKFFILTLIIAALIFFGNFEDFILLFKDSSGNTIWQYVANFSSGVLIIILSITAIVLFISLSDKQKANRELETIKNDLENRVRERTATLDESNQRLKIEIEDHLNTSARLKESEHYINSILKTMPTMLVGLDPNGTITQWNEKAEQFTGIKAPDAIGFDLWEAYPIITVSREQVNEALTNEQATTIRQNQRGLFHFDITIYPLLGTGESGVVLLIDDVSKQVKSENKLIQKDMMSSMGELASSMAHDMNSPLQEMLKDISSIESKLDSLDTDNVKAQLQHAIGQGNQARAIVNNLLNFASTATNDMQCSEMTELVDHSIELAQQMMSSRTSLSFGDIKIEREYDEDIPKVKCYSAEIQQVFLSLLRHCYYCIGKVDKADFEPVITVRILESYDALWLKISHNGQGLTNDEQQSIFEPFFSNNSLDNNEEANKRLSFSYFVVTEHHNGQMAVTSDVSVGTTFHMEFQLPECS